MNKISFYLKQAGKYNKGFEKEVTLGYEGAMVLADIFETHKVSVIDFVRSNKYGQKYIDKLKGKQITDSRDDQLLNELERHVIKFKKQPKEEWVRIFVDGEPMYVKEIDSTHVYINHQPKEAMPLHIAQIKNKKLYKDIVSWINGDLNLKGKKYTN